MEYLLLKVRRRISRIPVPLLVAVVVLVGLTATILQIVPRSQAAATTISDVTITPRSPEAALKAGPDDVCVVSNRTTFTGDPNKVSQFIEAVSRTARESGAKVDTDGSEVAPGRASYDLNLSYEFPLSQWSITPEQCALDELTIFSRGRSTLEIPGWARGMLAAAANVAIYVAVTFAVMALFTFLAPEFEIYGLMVSGCVAGFASSVVGNLINQVKVEENLAYSAAKCVAGAILNVTLAKTVTEMMTALRGWLGTATGETAGKVVVENLLMGESSRRSMEETLSRLAIELANGLPLV